MSDLDKKMMKMTESCNRCAQKEYEKLEEEFEEEIKSKIQTDIQEYHAESEQAFKKKLQKISKEYNAKVYEVTNQIKKTIHEKQESLFKQIKNDLKQKIIEFVDTEQYAQYLENNIREAMMLAKEEKNNEITILLTERDCDRYQDKIMQLFQVEVASVGDEYIGGCICKNHTNHVYIDNTLKNSIEEEMERMNLEEW